jgi:predicted NBD/HSP70 family sugar kinase
MPAGTPEPARSAPGSAVSLRAANQRRVLSLLLDRGGRPPATQAEIARKTGLAAGTVSTIVRDLAAAGIVTTVAGAGRRGTTVQLARGAGLVAGVDFGHGHVGVAVSDMSGQVLCEGRQALPPGHTHTEGLRTAREMLDRLLEGIDDDRKVLRNIGMGLPAPLSDNVVMSSSILPGWTGVDAREEAAQAFGVDVLIENDANLGALAEHRHGHGRGHANVVFVKVSSGVGAGMILDNTLFRGTSGTSGEVGHLTLDEQGPLCRCGSRGCLEAYAATGPALAMMHEQMPGAGIDEVIEAARHGNVAALRVFEDAGLHLGWGLAMVTNLVNPGVILIGGDMAHADELLLESARLGMRRHVLAGTTTTPVKVAALGDRAPLVGALVLAIDATDLVPGSAA